MREVTIRNNQRNIKLFCLYNKLQKETNHPENSRDEILERALELVVQQSENDPDYFRHLAEINLDLTGFDKKSSFPSFIHVKSDERQWDIVAERIGKSFGLSGAVKAPFMLRLVLTAYYLEESKKGIVSISESKKVNTDRIKKAIADLVITLVELEDASIEEVLDDIGKEIKIERRF